MITHHVGRTLGRLLIALAAALACVFCSCTLKVAGATETGNGQDEICGKLAAFKASNAAANAQVHLRRAMALADTSAVSLDVALVRTNAEGRYAINNVDTGLYVVEGIDSANNRAIIDSVHIGSTADHNDLGADTLRPTGAIRGKIRLSEGGDASKVLILAYGTDNPAWAASDGNFKAASFAQSRYRLHVLPLLPDYAVLDTGLVKVTSAETTDVGTIALVFTGVPTPKNVTLSYDSLKEIVTLMWNKPTSNNNYAGFIVYRRDVDSGATLAPLCRLAATDTALSDSFTVQNRKYEYGVACVDSTGKIGTLSSTVTVTITTVLKIISSWGDSGTGPGQLMQPYKIAIDDSGNVFVIDNFKTRVQKFTSAGTFSFAFHNTLSDANGICTNASGNVFVAEGTPQSIVRFDGNGNLISTLGVGLSVYQGVGVDSSDEVYAIGRTVSQGGDVFAVDTNAQVFSTWQTCSDPRSIFVGADQRVCVSGINCIVVSNSSGNTGVVFSLPIGFGKPKTSNLVFESIVSGKNGNVIVLETQSNQLFVFGPSGVFIGRSQLPELVTGLAVDKDGNIYGSEFLMNKIIRMSCPL